MTPKLIVAICSTTGPQSGKSTYLETQVKRQLPEAVHLRFSDPLINFLCDGLHLLHGKTRDDYEELKRAVLLPAVGCKRAVTGRDFMIAAGDALRKALRPSLYADIFIERLNRLEDSVVILDDLRKLPEIEALVNSPHNVLIVDVQKPGSELNDCEFTYRDLWTRVNRLDEPERVRFMAVTWADTSTLRFPKYVTRHRRQ